MMKNTIKTAKEELFKEVLDALLTSSPYGPFIDRAEKALEKIYMLGYENGTYDERSGNGWR